MMGGLYDNFCKGNFLYHAMKLAYDIIISYFRYNSYFF